MSLSGLPHSEILGSKPVCGSPGLIAACHVLHRLLAPRHSPYALSSLTKCHLHTARVWSKNYRLRGIQLSKNLEKLSALSGRLWANFSSYQVCCSLPGNPSFRPPSRFALRWTGSPSVARGSVLRPTFAKATVGILRVHSRAKDGGEYRARTGDLLVANQALSQLS